jgi:hypothetical protein
VAALYQRLGLLTEEVAASSYWPGTFSTEKEDISLLDGCHLMGEVTVDFPKVT